MGATQGKHLEDHQIDCRVQTVYKSHANRQQLVKVINVQGSDFDFGEACCRLWLSSTTEQPNIVTIRAFTEFVALALGRGYDSSPCKEATPGAPKQITSRQFFLKVFQSSDTNGMRDLFSTLRLLSNWPGSEQKPETEVPIAMQKLLNSSTISEADCDVIYQQFPHVWNTLSSYIELRLLVVDGAVDETPAKQSHVFFDVFQAVHNDHPIWHVKYKYPRLTSGDDAIDVAASVLGGCKQNWLLPLSVNPIFCQSGSWTLLYSSRHHGHGTNRLQHHVFKYGGPSALVIQDTEHNTIVCTLDVEWEESSVTRGGDDCRCYFFDSNSELTTYKPNTQIYFQTKGRSDHGLGIYSKTKKRIWLESDLKTGTRSIGPGSTPGIDLPMSVSRIEIWGCGGAGAVTDQQARRAIGQTVVDKASKAKRLDWGLDRSMLMMAGTNTGRGMAESRIDVAEETATKDSNGKRIVY